MHKIKMRFVFFSLKHAIWQANAIAERDLNDCGFTLC